MYYFIRHAESTFNIARQQMRQKYGRKQYHIELQWLKKRFDLQYSDSPISQLGIKQAEQCRLKMANQDIDFVLVSPLRRTLETCNIVFRDHKDKPKIIVDPHLRQYFQSTCDIGNRMINSIKDFPHFDFSLIKDPEAWYIHQIFDEEVKNKILKNLKGLQGKQRWQKASDLSYEFIKQWHTRIIDDQKILQEMKGPMRKQKQYIRQTYGSNDEKKIAVVTHSQNIKAYFQKALSNCQIYKIPSKQL